MSIELCLVSRANARVVPWKNGRGKTTEFAVWPEGSSLGGPDFAWRISAAEVESAGPFSNFPGCDRVLTVTRGAGLILDHGVCAPRAFVNRLEPYRFSGGWPTSADLVAGPVLDFGVIYRRHATSVAVRAVTIGCRPIRERLTSAHVFLHVVTGRLFARTAVEDKPWEVSADDSLWARGARSGHELVLTSSKDGCEVLIVRLGEKGQVEGILPE
jgi:uncharacterized protein